MDEKEIKRGVRNAWILAGLLLLLVFAWLAFTMWANREEVQPHWVQGGKPFVPGESIYGTGYATPALNQQQED